jgi:hypothetical protein
MLVGPEKCLIPKQWPRWLLPRSETGASPFVNKETPLANRSIYSPFINTRLQRVGDGGRNRATDSLPSAESR